MRHLLGAAAVATTVLMALSTPALATGEAQTPPAAAESPENGWRGVIYPVYGWLPIYRADVRLPDLPEGNTDANLSQAVLAAFRVEKGRFALEGGYVYAGLSGEAEEPFVKLEVDTSIADLRAGYEVVPDLYLEGGVRYLALEMKATISDYPAESWKRPDTTLIRTRISSVSGGR